MNLYTEKSVISDNSKNYNPIWELLYPLRNKIYIRENASLFFILLDLKLTMNISP